MTEDDALMHVLTSTEWARARRSGAVRPASLEVVGFVHLCLRSQRPGVVERFFAGVPNLLSLQVPRRALDPARLRFEDVIDVGGEKFPHYYTELPTSLITRVEILW